MEQGSRTARADDSGSGPAHDSEAAIAFLEGALQRLGEKRSLVLAILGILAVTAIGIVDGWTGHEFGYSLFYLIPITIVAFYGGKRPGIAVAFAATVAWFFAENYSRPPYSNSLAIYWNTGVRLLIFAIITLTLARLKETMVIEKAHLNELAELNLMKNQFVGMAAHDLRTPLSVIWMCAESLQKGQGDTHPRRQSESLEIIREKSDFMLKMVASLLDLSAIESGNLSLHKKCGDYGDFVRRHIETLQILADRKQLTLKFESGTLPSVSFDGDRIEQVLDNLIMNAVKFSPPHAAITVAVSCERDRVVTRVTDCGPGIPPDELPQVFVAFAKTSVKPASGEKGAGLGLAIAKKIVKAHGGEIAVTSVRGAGTTFVFTLPAGCG